MGEKWVLLAAILWSSGGVVIKSVPLGGAAVTAGRALFTVAFFALVVRPRLRRASLVTALGYAGMIATFVLACKQTTAAQAIVLQYSGTAWVLLAGPRFLGERFRWRDLAVAAVAILAMALCAQDTASPGQGLGNLLGVLSGVCYAVTVVSMRRSAAQGQPGSAEASLLAGNLLAFGACIPFGWRELRANLDLAGAAGLGYLGIVQIGLAYWAFARGLRTVPAATAALLALAEPVLTPLWVWLGTGERPTAMTVLAGLVIVVALGWRSWAGRRD
ncbi:MAG: DMT family transporter [Deltaproteobacteria bacterium]|nr:DMT family transporter [Deltaproteobacteria bacterium]